MVPSERDRFPSTGGGSGGEGASRRPSRDELLRVLADGHRRRVLSCLSAAPEDDVTVDELCERLSDLGCRGSATAPERGRDRLALRLHHDHLPRLADAGLLEYDPRHRRISYTGYPAVESLLHDLTTLVDDARETCS